jgi:hypothetical protein
MDENIHKYQCTTTRCPVSIDLDSSTGVGFTNSKAQLKELCFLVLSLPIPSPTTGGWVLPEEQSHSPLTLNLKILSRHY